MGLRIAPLRRNNMGAWDAGHDDFNMRRRRRAREGSEQHKQPKPPVSGSWLDTLRELPAGTMAAAPENHKNCLAMA